MKVMLLSVKPKWLCKILNGEKIREVRKLLPYDYQGPVVVYCSKASNANDYLVYKPNDKKFELVSKDLVLDDELNGKVCAIFNCDSVFPHKYVTENDLYDLCNHSNFLKESCLTLKELKKYLGSDRRSFYSMKISDLRAFENPLGLQYDICTGRPAKFPLHNPPQNYCYIWIETPFERLSREISEAIKAELEACKQQL